MIWLWLVAAVAMEPSSDGLVSLAEGQRIEKEIDRLAARSAWPVVERLFVKLESGGYFPRAATYVHAFQSARIIGDMLEVRRRMYEAFRQNKEQHLQESITVIDRNYGEAFLACDPNKGLTLTIDGMPFDPEQRRAISYAQRLISVECHFSGLLPAGSYHFGESDFDVRPQIESIYLDKRTIDGDRLAKAIEKARKRWEKEQKKAEKNEEAP